MSCRKHDYRVAKTRLLRIGYDVTAYRLQCYHTAVTPVCVNIYVWHKTQKEHIRLEETQAVYALLYE